MRCPQCASIDSKVIDSRMTGAEDAIRRRRECDGCSNRFTTYERVERVPVLVVKKDGQREGFDAAKMLQGLYKALHRRPVPAHEIEDFARDLEARLSDGREREVSTATIGEEVMGFLRRVDQIAYVRFASVYREFKDIGGLYAEVKALIEPADQDQK